MAKKEKKPKKPMQVWKLYEAKGETVERKNKFCPKCGPGFFMANHSNRLTCGKCYYTEFTEEIKKEEPKKEEAKKEPKPEETKEKPKPEKEEAKEAPKEEQSESKKTEEIKEETKEKKE